MRESKVGSNVIAGLAALIVFAGAMSIMIGLRSCARSVWDEGGEPETESTPKSSAPVKP